MNFIKTVLYYRYLKYQISCCKAECILELSDFDEHPWQTVCGVSICRSAIELYVESSGGTVGHFQWKVVCTTHLTDQVCNELANYMHALP